MSQLHEATMLELAKMLADKQVSSREATQACLDRELQTRTLNAYLFVNNEQALAAADASDARRARGDAKGPLDGVPMAIKDILVTREQPTTCASKILEGFMSPYDATVVTKLNEAGIVPLGKLNMDEFAMGSSNEHSAYGPTRNPWDPERVPGGSSGGSAAAVAAGSTFASLGTDTGGSIRQPASMTGTVGLKPTYGVVSRYGAMAYASSLDQIGPMTKDVADCAALLQLIAGHDEKDATSSAVEVPDYAAHLTGDIRGMRIGIPKEYYQKGSSAEVQRLVGDALRDLEARGATLVDVSLPHTEHGIATYYVLAPAEASSNLSRYDGVRFGYRDPQGLNLTDMYTHSRSQGFGSEVKRRIMLGAWVLSAKQRDAYYTQAQKNRALVKRDFDQVFEKVDVLATPCAPSTAFRLGEKEDDPMKMYLADIFTVTANLAGLCGISVPCGFANGTLPVGLQLLGAPHRETEILRVAHAYEQGHPWHKRRAG